MRKYKQYDKVVPFQKTNGVTFEESYHWNKAKEIGQPFLYVSTFDEDEGSYRLTYDIKEVDKQEGNLYDECDFNLYDDREYTTVKKLITRRAEDYGVIGEKVEGTEYHIGDIIVWQYSDHTRPYNDDGLYFNIISQQKGDNPFVMGWGCWDIREKGYEKDFKILAVAIPYTLLNDDVLSHYEGTFFTIKEEQVEVKRKLTLDELREYVPFNFELVD